MMQYLQGKGPDCIIGIEGNALINLLIGIKQYKWLNYILGKKRGATNLIFRSHFHSFDHRFDIPWQHNYIKI